MIENPSDCEIRSVIRFMNAQQVKPFEIYRQITSVYGENAMSEGMVRKWVRMFNEGRQNVHDEPGKGRKSVLNDSLISKIDAKIREDRRFTISSLSLEFPDISKSLLHDVVTSRLGYRKVCARWVPKMLTDDHKKRRKESAMAFLKQYRKEGDQMLSQIVTGDETWISHSTPESKEQSKQWKHSDSPAPKKFKQTASTKKIMCTVFWDRHGVLLVEFLPNGQTVNSDKYCSTLTNLRRAIQNKRRGMLSRGILLLHDNARPHTSAQTQNHIATLGWKQLNHPPYSPDLAPSDYHLFLHLKRFLSGQQFESDNDLCEETTNWLTFQAGALYEEGIQKLIPRYEKCLENGGNYVEK